MLGLVILLMPMVAGAQTQNPFGQTSVGGPGASGSEVNSVGDIFQVLCRVLGWLFVFFIAIAVIFVIYAGWKYLTAGGEEEKIKEANRTLIYAVVAMVVAVLARSIPYVVANFVGGALEATC